MARSSTLCGIVSERKPDLRTLVCQINHNCFVLDFSPGSKWKSSIYGPLSPEDGLPEENEQIILVFVLTLYVFFEESPKITPPIAGPIDFFPRGGQGLHKPSLDLSI